MSKARLLQASKALVLVKEMGDNNDDDKQMMVTTRLGHNTTQADKLASYSAAMTKPESC